MVAQVVNNNGTLEFRNLAGGSSDGLPIGSILALHDTRVPYGFLPCNGSTYDINQYPALYTILHSNRLPDLREMNLVGIGNNATADITTHDTYTLGQFKDDQVQETITGVHSEATATSTVSDPGHCHKYSRDTNTVLINASYGSCKVRSAEDSEPDTYSYTTGISVSTDVDITNTLETNANVRAGSTTHGKNYGVFFVIKAVTGAIDIDDATVYAQVVDLLESNYIQKSLFSEGGIPMYNSTTECFDQITPPAQNGLALSYDVTQGCYCWGETASAVANLTDVCLTNLCEGQVLKYNCTDCVWENKDIVSETSCNTTYQPVFTKDGQLYKGCDSFTYNPSTNCLKGEAKVCLTCTTATDPVSGDTKYTLNSNGVSYICPQTGVSSHIRVVGTNACIGGSEIDVCADSDNCLHISCMGNAMLKSTGDTSIRGNCVNLSATCSINLMCPTCVWDTLCAPTIVGQKYGNAQASIYMTSPSSSTTCIALNANTVCVSGNLCASNFCLSCLKDICLSSATSGQSLVYNGTKWVNCTVGGGGSSNCISDGCTSYVKVTGNQVDICSAGTCKICFKGTCSACYDPSNGTLYVKCIVIG